MSVGHDHASAEAAVSRTARRTLTIIAAGLAALTLAGMVALWPGDVRGDTGDLQLVSDVYDATVTKVTRDNCGGVDGPVRVVCDTVTFRLQQGPDKGDLERIEIAESVSAPNLEPGDEIVLNHLADAEPGFEYTYADRQRRPVLLWLTVLFAGVVIALGRLRGLAALVGLGLSIVVILQFVIPAMLDGHSATLVAIVGSSAVAFLALYLANGFRSLTTVALLGTLAALGVTVVLATIFTELAQFTGGATEDALLVRLGASTIDLRGLVLAGMVLGALGALDDVTVTQASAVGELRVANPTMPRRELYRAGLRIGREHISSTVNTLALAYAGASLPLLILFTLSSQSLGAIANSEVVAVEIVATMVGSIGLVTAVPISTWFAALVSPAPHVGAEPTESVRRRSPRFRELIPRRPAAPTPSILEPRSESDFWD